MGREEGKKLTNLVSYSTNLVTKLCKLILEKGKDMVEFGDKLKELRKKEGLTQKQLGERIGVSKSMVSYYEAKERSPGPETLVRIARAFHVTPDYFLDAGNGRTINIEGLDPHDEEIVRRIVTVMRKLREESEKEKR